VKQVNISDAKNNLSRYLELVKQGGRIRILDRDVPVADLVPIVPDSSDDDGRLIADLVRRGLVRPGEPGPLPPELLRAGPKGRRRRAGARVLEALLEERESGR
jgi:antitoxin (DNA-binding transcriptional repressor) of toxin-antitoxin stability system